MGKNKKWWYHGWNIVFFASLVTLISNGLRMSIGPFLIPLTDDFNITRTTMSSIISASMFIFGVAMPVAGFLERRFGPKVMLIGGALINLIATIWMINTQSLLGLFLSFGVLTSFGLAFAGNVVLTPTLVRWFVRRRGQALLYLSAGGMAGIAVMNPLSNALVSAFDWKLTMLSYAIGLGLLVVFMVLFVIRTDIPENADLIPDAINEKPQKKIRVEQEPEFSVKASLKTRTFWYIALGLFTCGFSMNLIGTHGIPMLEDRGFSSTVASTAVGSIGLVALVGVVLMSTFADKISKKNIIAIIYFTRGIGIICMVWVALSFQLYIVAVIAGLAWSGNVSLSSAILSDVYGVKLVGILFGMAFFVHQIGATISTFLGGWAYETFGTHWIAFGGAGVLLFMAGTVSLRISMDTSIGKAKLVKVSGESV